MPPRSKKVADRSPSEIMDEGMAKMDIKSRANSTSSSGSAKTISLSRENSSSSARPLSRGSSGASALSGSVRVVNATMPFKVSGVRFIHKKYGNFVPQNTTFIYNPSEPLQVAEVGKKLKDIKEKAKSFGVQFETIEADGMSYTGIDAVGGASKDMVGVKFPPPDLEKSWMKATERKKKTKTAAAK